jgi:two-component system heavy metal sensor histidine kinase CusS
MVADMLFLAKADHGLMLPTREDIDLGREVRGLFDFYEALAEERRVGLRCEGEARMRGDRLMIRRALSNLLSNALRHSAAGTAIAVSLANLPDGVVVAVENAGDTVDPGQISRLFERFYRADSARAHDDSQGAGLGLAIAKAIVEAHGGSIGVTSAAGRTRFVLKFPAV